MFSQLLSLLKRVWWLLPTTSQSRERPLQPQQMWLGFATISLVNLGLRFWRLATPRPLTFDEVYYVGFAADILQNQSFFDAHPPLGKYLIALSIVGFQAFQRLLGIADQNLATLMLDPMSYRWLNAGIGTLIPLLGGWLAWEWGRSYPQRRRQVFALLAALLISLDGLLLAESRLALLHVALLSLGLTGLAAWERSHHSPLPCFWRLLAGLALGTCANVKWNGAGYLLALWCLEGYRHLRDRTQHLPHIRTRPWLWLGVLPCGAYILGWLPYLDLTGHTLWDIHKYLWQFHTQVAATHPYQSVWYTWPLMIRPIAYFYQGLSGNEPLGIGPPTPEPEMVIAVYGMDNPILIWLGTAAITLLLLRQVVRFRIVRDPRFPLLSPPKYLIVTYLANWLPWTVIGRSTFFYHYLTSGLMSAMGLAWFMSQWLTGDRASWQWVGWGILGLILVGFGFWLPLWIGWPLPLEAIQQRFWLPSWR